MTRITTIVFCFLTCIANNIYGQAALPTSWDISGTPPMGWTINDIDYFSSSQYSGIAPPAAKLNNTGDYIEVAFNEDPGALTYSIQGSGNGPWKGTFNVEESVDGNSWSIMRQFQNGDIDVSNMNTYSDIPQATSRYVRFYYETKISGNNTSLDDIGLVKPPAGPAQEIHVLEADGEQILTGDNTVVSSPSNQIRILPLYIHNLGTQDTLEINIPGSSITGPYASEYDFISNITDIPPGEFRLLEIEFNPLASGTREATILLQNNDADESPYAIHVTGYGDHIATEPLQVAGMTVIQNLAYDLEVNFSNPAGEGVIVLQNAWNPLSTAPMDKVVYETGQAVGNAKVVYKGPAPATVLNEILAGVDYYFGVYSYNGSDTFVNYRQMGAQDLMVTSDNGGPGNYYSNIDPTSPTFPIDLHQLIRPHFQIYYSNYTFDYLIPFEERDTVNEMKVAECMYSGEIKLYIPPFAFTAVDFSREHVFPQSWMPYTSNISDSAFYSDLFNLFTTRFTDVNALRSNFPLGEVDVPIQSYLEGTLGTSYFGGDTLTVYEPKDDIKGDAARAMMYMLACYDRVGGVRWKLPQSGPFRQNQAILKKWNMEDPPGPFEKARNEFISSLQNNRNPFIDNYEWACYIDFHTMEHVADPDSSCGVNIGIEAPSDNIFRTKVFPIPATGSVTFKMEKLFTTVMDLRIYDLRGREVYMQEISAGKRVFELATSFMNPGIYTYEIKDTRYISTGKIVIQ